MKQLTIDGSYPAEPDDYSVEVDFYVPLTVRSERHKNDPPWYIQQMGSPRSLLEFLVDPISKAIVGITLTLVESWRDPGSVRDLPRTCGVPIARIPEDAVYHEPKLERPWLASVIKIDAPFGVGFGPGLLEIDLGALDEADTVIENGQIEFYLKRDVIVGLRVVRLSAKQISDARRGARRDGRVNDADVECLRRSMPQRAGRVAECDRSDNW